MELSLLRGEPASDAPHQAGPDAFAIAAVGFHDVEKIPSFPHACHFEMLHTRRPEITVMSGVSADLPHPAAWATFQEFAADLNYFWIGVRELENPAAAIATYHVIFSRRPPSNARAFALPVEYARPRPPGYLVEGRRCALTATLPFRGGALQLCVTRLEDKTGPAGRAKQMDAVLRKWVLGGEPQNPADTAHPALLFGGLNTIIVDGSEPDSHAPFADRICRNEPKAFLNPISREPLFGLLAGHQFNWDAYNEPFVPTYHHPGIRQETKIDWMIGRGLSHQVERVRAADLLADPGAADPQVFGHAQILELKP